MTTREENRERILNNISAILDGMENLERSFANLRYHIAMNDAYFLHHLNNLKDPHYGSIEDLVELYLDTCHLLGRIRNSQNHLSHVCRDLHYYDYKTTSLFKEAEEWHGKHL